MSHDEILGLIYSAYFFDCLHIIDELQEYLDLNDGVYNNTTDKNIIGDSAFDMYRMAYVRPLLTAAMGIPLTLRSQAFLSVSMLSSAIFGKGSGTHWRQALVNDVCVKKSNGLTCLVYAICKMILHKKGITPVLVMSDYFGDEPHSLFASLNWK
jgi:hypothetical protein